MSLDKQIGANDLDKNGRNTFTREFTQEELTKALLHHEKIELAKERDALMGEEDPIKQAKELEKNDEELRKLPIS